MMLHASRMPYWISSVLIVMLTATISSAFFYWLFPEKLALVQTEPAPFVLQEFSPHIPQISFNTKTSYPVDREARVLLMPHHLVAGREIASLLTSSPTPRHVLLLSPDHFARGKQALSTTRRSFIWEDERVIPDQTLIDRLTNAHPETLRVQDEVFRSEHGIRGLIPFIHTAWPNTEIASLTVRTDASIQTMRDLAQTLEQELQTDPGLMVIVTIDFSHELPAYLADLHDAHSSARLNTLQADALRTVEIDSPPLFFLLTTLIHSQNRSLEIQAHTNSLRLMNALITEHGTSHLLASDTVQSSSTSPNPRFTFFHDPARHIVSSEDRAYRGYDELREIQIPFPAAFVREDQNGTSTWHAIPLRQTGDQSWELVSDAQFSELAGQRASWEMWARMSLLGPSSE